MYIFGGAVTFPIEDITPTYLTEGVLSTLRQADYLATKILHDSGEASRVSQMPVVLTPLHFNRDPIMHQPSCQRSVALRTFITNDFMTGIPAIPGQHISLEVRISNTVITPRYSIHTWCDGSSDQFLMVTRSAVSFSSQCSTTGENLKHFHNPMVQQGSEM